MQCKNVIIQMPVVNSDTELIVYRRSFMSRQQFTVILGDNFWRLVYCACSVTNNNGANG